MQNPNLDKIIFGYLSFDEQWVLSKLFQDELKLEWMTRYPVYFGRTVLDTILENKWERAISVVVEELDPQRDLTSDELKSFNEVRCINRWEIFNAGARHGLLEVVKKTIEYLRTTSPVGQLSSNYGLRTGLWAAAENGRIDVLDYLSRSGLISRTRDVLSEGYRRAAGSGVAALELVASLAPEEGFYEEDNWHAVRFAASRGRLPVLEWFREKFEKNQSWPDYRAPFAWNIFRGGVEQEDFAVIDFIFKFTPDKRNLVDIFSSSASELIYQSRSISFFDRFFRAYREVNGSGDDYPIWEVLQYATIHSRVDILSQVRADGNYSTSDRLNAILHEWSGRRDCDTKVYHLVRAWAKESKDFVLGERPLWNMLDSKQNLAVFGDLLEWGQFGASALGALRDGAEKRGLADVAQKIKEHLEKRGGAAEK